VREIASSVPRRGVGKNPNNRKPEINFGYDGWMGGCIEDEHNNF